MQLIQIIGNLGEDVQIREVSGRKFASFRVACTEKIQRGDETLEVTTWYSCSYNRPESKVMQYLVRGAKVFVQGLPSYAIYDSATYHCKMIDVRIFVDRIELCGSKPQQGQAQEQKDDDVQPF